MRDRRRMAGGDFAVPVRRRPIAAGATGNRAVSIAAHFRGSPVRPGEQGCISFAMIDAILRGNLDVLLARS